MGSMDCGLECEVLGMWGPFWKGGVHFSWLPFEIFSAGTILSKQWISLSISAINSSKTKALLVYIGGTKTGAVKITGVKGVTSEGLSEAWFIAFSVIFDGNFNGISHASAGGGF